MSGINFALDKWCAKSFCATIYNPTYATFLDHGMPREELYSVSDGLHLNGAGVDRLEAAIAQALSTGYLLEKARYLRLRKLAVINY